MDMFLSFRLLFFKYALEAAPENARRIWSKRWAKTCSAFGSQALLCTPWSSAAPLGELYSWPSDERIERIARAVALSPAIFPESDSPSWEAAFLLALARQPDLQNALAEWPLARARMLRIASTAAESWTRPCMPAHSACIGLESRAAQALRRSVDPEGFIAALFSASLTAPRAQARIDGFGEPIHCSAADRLASHMLAEHLPGAAEFAPAHRPEALRGLRRGFAALEPLSIEGLAAHIRDGALVAWIIPPSDPRSAQMAWREAARAALGTERAELFSKALALEGAAAAAEALGPTPEERERETISDAIGQSAGFQTDSDPRRL